jgi:hypothetical protein
MTTTPLIPTERPFLPNHRNIPVNSTGLLKDIGPINIGFGIAVPTIKGNDPVSFGTRVSTITNFVRKIHDRIVKFKKMV